MALYRIPDLEIDIHRKAVLLDTNVLCAAFDPGDDRHDDAEEFLEVWEYPFIVSMGVVIEAWGLLVGSRKLWQEGLDLFAWLNNPGNASLVPQHSSLFGGAFDLIGSLHVDCVDALLSHLADDVSSHSFSDSDIAIATYDTADIVNCRQRKGLRIKVLDLRSKDYAIY